MAEQQEVSTSRLANMLKIEVAVLFRLLADSGWIVRDAKQWHLTDHGALEGGRYQNSEQFGRYIVWPSTLIDHPLLHNAGREYLSASRLGELNQLSAYCINSLLAELGWLDKEPNGWMITDLGKKQGGTQRNGKHGFFVLWPLDIQENSLLQAAVDNATGKKRGPCLDGLVVNNAAQQRLNNWFYLHHIVRAWQHPVPGSHYSCTFYLPARKVFVDYWGIDPSTGSLMDKMDKQAFYRANGLRFIDLNDDDIQQLDTVLPQQLLSYGMPLFPTTVST